MYLGSFKLYPASSIQFSKLFADDVSFSGLLMHIIALQQLHLALAN